MTISHQTPRGLIEKLKLWLTSTSPQLRMYVGAGLVSLSVLGFGYTYFSTPHSKHVSIDIGEKLQQLRPQSKGVESEASTPTAQSAERLLRAFPVALRRELPADFNRSVQRRAEIDLSEPPSGASPSLSLATLKLVEKLQPRKYGPETKRSGNPFSDNCPKVVLNCPAKVTESDVVKLQAKVPKGRWEDPTGYEWKSSASMSYWRDRATLYTDGHGGQKVTVDVDVFGPGYASCSRSCTIDVKKSLKASRPKDKSVTPRKSQAPSGDKADYGFLSVFVSDNETKESLEGITVTLIGPSGPASGVTDDEGGTAFRDLQTGAYQVSVNSPGYSPFSQSVMVEQTPTMFAKNQLNIVLRHPPSTMSSVGDSSATAAPSSQSNTASPVPGITEASRGKESPPSLGERGTLEIYWPPELPKGWSSSCGIRYKPTTDPVPDSPGGVASYVSFKLFRVENLKPSDFDLPYKPLNRTEQEWEIPLEPQGNAGSRATWTLVMAVREPSPKTGLPADRISTVDLQTGDAVITRRLITQKQSLLGSILLALAGTPIFGMGFFKSGAYPQVLAYVGGSTDRLEGSPMDTPVYKCPDSHEQRVVEYYSGAPPTCSKCGKVMKLV